ncbi:hypothetical protein AXF42_Ash016831 [Apostasia shenzhenica]|uniref:Uncharacterized protein n=1 Tax=Apostasia shenzhenica TaxID=1088818 RepID=A0A2I0BAI3_9ASPA|nr:hypothetical protein AXF42_Ash016831 [Apostasia shenzhenica]
MVARTRRTNSEARSTHAGEPSVRAPGDEALQRPGAKPNLLLSPKIPALQSYRGCWQTSLI